MLHYDHHFFSKFTLIRYVVMSSKIHKYSITKINVGGFMKTKYVQKSIVCQQNLISESKKIVCS